MASKTCNICKETKDVSDFYKCKSNKDGLQRHCKSCDYERGLLPQAKLNMKKSRLKIRFKLTVEDYNNMLTEQNNRCSICFFEGPLVIDHDHETGKVRGLLCADCNKGLGFFNDNSIFLENAVSYLNGY